VTTKNTQEPVKTLCGCYSCSVVDVTHGHFVFEGISYFVLAFTILWIHAVKKSL